MTKKPPPEPDMLDELMAAEWGKHEDLLTHLLEALSKGAPPPYLQMSVVAYLNQTYPLDTLEKRHGEVIRVYDMFVGYTVGLAPYFNSPHPPPTPQA